ncbi:MAG: tandem-95 repeat protein [Sedimentisphaerales bacterium]|nr:tandem-95 repeat protein [Sedimentisphaerales bacterium]
MPLPRAMALESGNIIDSAGIIGTPTWGDHTIIDTDHGAIINWNNFNTSSGQIVEFRQYLDGSQNDMSAVLNRISSGSIPTEFNGALNANGRVFLVNPAGIVFGAGSTINVSQLVASGLNMSDWAFDAILADPDNQMVFEGGDGDVTSRAIIQAGDSVYLIGNRISNLGVIVAPNGLLVMAAGDNIYLAQDGSNVLVELESNPTNDFPDIRNSGNVNIANGSIVLAAGDSFSRAIKNVGILSASGGSITAQAARVENNGYMIVDSSSGDAGSIILKGVEEVTLGPDVLGNTGQTTANAGSNGDGGTITIESEGTVTLAENALVEAKGGAISGDGGHIQINSEHFVIASDIDASPGNTDYEPGTLKVGAADVTIAAGANLGELDTIYEEDLEALSQTGTSLIVQAQDSVTVQDMPDDIIDGRYGNIELHATGANSIVSFEDKTDTISTTLGDIVMEAGSGGIDIGSLETGKDLSDMRPMPGQITLTTNNEGDITTENLTIKDGWGHAEINVNASGDLTVNGDVAVGRDSAINNIPLGADAEAMIYLKAGGNLILEGDVQASADGIHEGLAGGVTKAYIGISGGSAETGYGDTTINGDLVATANSTSQGTSEATIEIDSWGYIYWGLEAAVPVADADEAHVESRTNASQEVAGNVAQILVNPQNNAPAPQALPDFSEIHMGDEVTGNVLDNDFDPEGEPITAALIDGPTHAESFTLSEDGSYSYTPEPGYVGTDSFTYTASAGGGTSAPVSVTITMTNTLPVAETETQTTHMGVLLDGTILDNISDADDDPLITALVTDTEHGILTLNPDGTYTYEPEEGFVGTDSFTFSVADGQIDVEPVEGTVTITMTNSAPISAGDAKATHMGVNLEGKIQNFVSDPDGDPLITAIVTETKNGTLTLDEDGNYIYKPDEGYVGTDSFTFTAYDGELDAEPVQLTATILITNTQPTLKNDTAQIVRGTTVVIDVLTNDSDPDGDPFTVNSFTYEGTGTLVLNEDNTFTYTPAKGFYGEESFTYTVSDGQIGAEPVETTVTIEVSLGYLPPAPLNMPTGPGLERTNIEISGCPALTKWAAKELGTDERMMEIFAVNGLASTVNIQPCEAYSNLKKAANVLTDGIHLAALIQVINDYAFGNAPLSTEQIASIAEALARNTKTKNQYGIAEKYLAALSDYVSILSMELAFSPEESVQFAYEKYVDRLADSGNVAVADYLAARLNSLSVFLSMSLLEPANPYYEEW